MDLTCRIVFVVLIQKSLRTEHSLTKVRRSIHLLVTNVCVGDVINVNSLDTTLQDCVFCFQSQFSDYEEISLCGH